MSVDDIQFTCDQMGMAAQCREPRTTDGAGFGLARSPFDLSAANQIKPAGFFERLDSRHAQASKQLDLLRDRLIGLAEKIGAPQYPPLASDPRVSQGSEEPNTEDAVSVALRRADSVNADLDFLIGLAGRIAERL